MTVIQPLLDEPALLAAIGIIVLALAMSPLRDRASKRRMVEGKPGAKLRAYADTLVLLWGLAGVSVVCWIVSGRTVEALGWRAAEGIGGIVAWVIAGLGCAYFALIISQALTSAKVRAAIRRQFDTGGDIELLRPRRTPELAVYQFVAISAGVTEEVVFRGFLIGAFALIAPVWAAAIGATILFLFGHVYQGPKGMIRIIPISALLTLLFVISGSLWPGMLLHAVVDLAAGALFALADRAPSPSVEAD